MWWSEDYGGLLARALGVPTPGFPIPTMLDLAFSVTRLYDMWKIKVILVNFCKSNFNQKEVRNVSRRTQPRFSYFFNLGIISSSSSSSSVAELGLDDIQLAICFYGQTYACLLTDEFRQEVVNQYKNSSRRDKPKDNNFAKIPIVNLEERRLALAKLEAQKKAKKRKASGAAGRPTPYKRTKICECSSCRSDTFTMNMNDDGPERAVVFQNHSLLPWLTCFENVYLGVERVFGHSSVVDRRVKESKPELVDRTNAALEMVGLSHAAQKRPGEISGGMKQRVGIARALAMQPQVLLMDEPFGALDALTRAKLQDELLAIVANTKSTVVMVTHDVDEAVLLSDKIVMMTNGPAATIGEVLGINLPRPRSRISLADNTDYLGYRKAVIDFLYTRQAHVEKT